MLRLRIFPVVEMRFLERQTESNSMDDYLGERSASRYLRGTYEDDNRTIEHILQKVPAGYHS